MVRGSHGFVRLALSAAALFWAQDLMAASYELEASGRDEAAALGNLKMTAVRESAMSSRLRTAERPLLPRIRVSLRMRSKRLSKAVIQS